MKLNLSPIAVLVVAMTATAALAQDDPFRTNVRPTPWLSPAQEQATFTLPPGFNMELFASEPQIQKPMNMAFDARGRLWLTDTIEYPMPVTGDKVGRDTVKILEDTTGDGKADRITTFADGLNIPIGLIPHGDGAIVWSIPYIWFLHDTDGDGRADKREKLFGPMGWERDTHGMNNGFTRGYDGWIYACHGFNNQTTVQGADGHAITMQSGNTYRFRPDGSRIEHFTHGQVNPFGMTITEFGDLITADCHSKPLYLLMRDGFYPSFGKPDDGLGFVPPIMTHSHGSTALCGPCYYAADHFPAAFHGNLFVGNVMTSRVNRNSIDWHGSTPVAVEQPDLVSSTDPWFRPVDLQQGPDGALYVADFYNRIIGHYEVPLDHPGRDRDSGRIWRIVYRGDDQKSQPAARPQDLTTATPDELISAMESPNLTYRLLAMNTAADETDHALPNEIIRQLRDSQTTSPAAISVLEQRGLLDDTLFHAALRSNVNVEMVNRLVQILSERDEISPDMHQWLLNLLRDDHYRGVVQRHVADALAQHARRESMAPLLEAISNCAADDPLLRHQLRIALRNHLRVEGALEQLDLEQLDPELASLTAEAALGTDSIAAGNFLVAYLARFDVPQAEKAASYAQHAARFAADLDFDSLANSMQSKFKDRPAYQLNLLQGIGRGLQQCGCRPSPALSAWARAVVGNVLQSDHDVMAWTTEALPGKPHRADMFVIEQRTSADGDSASKFFGSLPHGETLCGVYRSSPFDLPAEFSFYMAGHNGFPNVQQRTGNLIRLRMAADDRIVRETPPPRNDTAQRIVWNLADLKGERGYVEIVDTDSANAYAWLAVGRFSLDALNPSSLTNLLQQACEVTTTWGLSGFEPLLEKQLGRGDHDTVTEVALTEALLKSYGDDPRLSAVASLLNQSISAPLRQEIVAAALARNSEATERAMTAAMKSSPAAAQQKLAEQLAGSPLGASSLVALVAAGSASPRLLTLPTVSQRLAAVKNADLTQQISDLTASLPPANEALAERIAATKKQFATAGGLAEQGRAVFKRNCAVCHRIGEEGEMIAPQLDGIGNRGLDRVLEDLLDPHRNVDVQFRTTTLILNDGKILSGLVRQAEEKVIELVDSQGKKTTITAADIEARKASPLSLMPDNMVDKLSPAELNDLLAFLLSQTAPSAHSSGE